MKKETINKLKELMCQRDGIWNERLAWEIKKRKNSALQQLIDKVESGDGDDMDDDNLYMVYGKELNNKFISRIKTIDDEISGLLHTNTT